jgi:hypothetical protein
MQHMMKPPPSLVAQVPTLSRVVDQVVLKALAKDPRDRFVTVQDFAAALEQAARQGSHMSSSFRSNQSLPSAMPDRHSPSPISSSEHALSPYPNILPAPSSPTSPPLVSPQVTSPHLSGSSLLSPMTEIGSTGQSALPIPSSASVETSPVAEKLSQSIYELSSQARSDLPPLRQTQQPSPSNAGSRSAPSNAASAPNQFTISPPSLPSPIIPSSGQPSQPLAKAWPRVQVPRPPHWGAAVPIAAHRGGHLRGRTALLVALVLLIIGSVSILYTKRSIPNAHLPSTATTHTQAGTTATAVAAVNAYNTAVAAKGVMFGFDPAHTHVNPYEHILNPTNISRAPVK